MATNVVGRRILGGLVDYILSVAVALVLMALTFESADLGFGADGFCTAVQDEFPACFQVNETVVVGGNGDLAVVILGSMLFWFAIRAGMHAITGRSPGKYVAGIKVVNAQGDNPNIGQAIVRELLFIPDGFFFFLVGIITMSSSQQNRRVGDMAAKTFVVGKDAIFPEPHAPHAYGSMPAPGAPPPQAEPQWDPVRNTYVHRDETGHLQVYDNATGEWVLGE